MPEAKQTNQKPKARPSKKKSLATIKLIAIPLSALVMFMIGMAVGYRYGGGAAGEVFNLSTWRNILFIIFG